MPQYRARVAANGRMVIPAPVRSALSLRGGGEVVLRVEDSTVRIETLADSVHRAQEMVRRRIPRGTSLAEELAADRRAEAEEPGR